jgi:hypothetical protein
MLGIGTGMLSNEAYAQSVGTLRIDVRYGDELGDGAQIQLFKEGGFVNGSNVGSDGYVIFPNLSPGKYNVKVLYLGEQKELIGVPVVSGATRRELVKLGEDQGGDNVTKLEEIVIQEQIVKTDATSNSTQFSNQDVKNVAERNINAVAGLTAGVYQKDGNSGINIGGGRSAATQVYIDGVRVISLGNNATVPQASIGEISVITRGIPPWFGDATSGVIEITSRDPAGQHSFGAEGVTSQFLDGYGYNLVALNASGPLLKERLDSAQKAQGIQAMAKIGYFLSAELESQKDPNPSYFGAYGLRDGLLDSLRQNPLRPDPNGDGFVNNANFLRSNDFIVNKAKPNNDALSLSLNGRLDFRLSPSMNLKAGGSARLYDASLWSLNNSVLTPEANEYRTTRDYRGFLRFTQYFTPDTTGGKSSVLKQFYYNLQADYTRSAYTRSDERHRDRYFDYGHVGTFNSSRAETFEIVQPGDAKHNPNYSSNAYWQTSGFIDTAYTFNGSNSRNPIQANYNNYIFQEMRNRRRFISLPPDVPFELRGGVFNQLDLLQLGGLSNGFNTVGSNPSMNIYSLWNGQGNIFGAYVKNQTDMFRFTAQATMILGRKSSKSKAESGEEESSTEKGTHTVKFGFEFDQRFERFYSLTTPALWNVMRNQSNKHLANLDPNSATPLRDENGFFLGRVNLRPLYDASSQSTFDKNFRRKAGLDTADTRFLDPDAFDPSFFSLDMFSANELFNGGKPIVNYYGFDYKGNVASNQPGESFFTDIQNRPMNAYAPTYIAGYVQDKFEIGDINLSLGFRVDRFDANQPVLRDKYILGNFYTAGDLNSTNEFRNLELPGTIQSSWVPYVNSLNNPTSVLGYRDGDFWYDRNGTPIDPTLLRSGGNVIPFLKPNGDSLSVESFVDYNPVVNFMPRVSFSFPINDRANFFAHYDVLTQRPTEANIGQYVNYLYLTQNATDDINNPALRPTRTVDYEIGFQQALDKNGNLAIQISAYYRDMKDMIQLTRTNNAFPISYDSYSNVDFGTVRGFTFEFLTRRLGIFKFRTSYTLQYAYGTGSSFTSSRNALNGVAGFSLIRTLLPLSFDQRHTITGNIDLRFEGKNQGPEIFGKRIFRNSGASLTFNVGSGTPYTRNALPNQADVQFGVNSAVQTQGTAFGSRLPFNYRFDLRVDKTFSLKLGKKATAEGGEEFASENDNRRALDFNVYVIFLNVFNIQNVFGVYSYSGVPNTSGYLESPVGPRLISGQINPASFVDQYRIREQRPDFYSLPIRIRLGLMVNF